MNIYKQRRKRLKQKEQRTASHSPQLGYVVDSASYKGPDDTKHFEHCPRCKTTVELYEKENLYNPKKMVKQCSKCGLIHHSSLWQELAYGKKKDIAPK